MHKPTRITTVLFDLDGTLLPMDQDLFAKTYIGGLAKAAIPHGKIEVHHRNQGHFRQGGRHAKSAAAG